MGEGVEGISGECGRTVCWKYEQGKLRMFFDDVRRQMWCWTIFFFVIILK